MTKLEQQLEKGIRLFHSGEIKQAEEVFRRIHVDQPLNVQARFFLGAAYIELGQPEKCIPLIEPVVAEFPRWSEAHNNLAIAYHKVGRCDDAMPEYDKAIQLNPSLVVALINRAFCLVEMGRKEDGLAAIEHAISVSPDNVEAKAGRVALLGELGRDPECIDAAKELLDKGALAVEQLTKIAPALYDRDTDLAVRAYEMLLELEPGHRVANMQLACLLDRTLTTTNRDQVLHRMLDLVDASLRTDPDYIEAHMNRAAIFQKLRRGKEMLEIFENLGDRAKDKPNYASNYAAALMEAGNYDAAIEVLEQATQEDSTNANAFYNWGASLQLRGQYEEALPKFTRALEIDPNHINSRTGRSLLYLTLGKFEEGWADYEIRKVNEQFTGRVINDNLLAKHDVQGRRILLHAEQGLGDTIQFVRYASIIKAMGASVVIECQDGLRELMSTCPDVDEVYERRETIKGEVTVTFDVQANMMSLPYVLKTTSVDLIPSQVPYLSATDEARATWTARIKELTPADTKLKVGIVWAGNPGHRTDLLRSATLAHFGALAGIDGLVCFSLQKGAEAEAQLQSPPEGLHIIPLGHELNSFIDTAAVMENLDLVIAVDTSVVHLAGAIGLPVWTLVAKSPDWRWMLNRDDTPWYPTMRLFRQREVRSWDPVFENIATELRRFAADPTATQIERAVEKFERGDRDRAKVELFCIARRFPSDTRVLNTLGEFLWADGDTQDALKVFVTAMQLAPGDRRTVRNCAEVFASFGQTENARMLYQSFLVQHPNDREFAQALNALDDGRVLATAA